MSLSPAHLEYEKENPRGIGGTSGVSIHPFTNGITTCDDMMLLHMNHKSIFGMSYPPPTHQVLNTDTANLGLVNIEMKFCSEPDLSNPSKQSKDNSPNGCPKNIFKVSEKSEKGRKRLESSDDSDLFFDFDIEEEPRKDRKTIPYGGLSTENLIKYPFVKDSDETVVLEDCVDSLHYTKDNFHSKAPSVSTAYGSIKSSPPASDEEGIEATLSQTHGNSTEGLALYPEDWTNIKIGSHDDKCPENIISAVDQDSNAEAAIESTKKENEPAISEVVENEPIKNTPQTISEASSSKQELSCEKILPAAVENADLSDNSSDEEDAEEKEDIKVGSAEQKFANSKLMTLLSLLEKDRDYSKSKKAGVSNHKTHKRHPDIGSVPKDISTHPLGASPVNFSFLRRPSKELEDISPLAKKPELPSDTNPKLDDNLLKPPPALKRCESAPSLQDTDVQFVISNEQQIPDAIASIDSPTTDSITEKTNEEEDEKSDEEEDSKDKYRRCSSLKSGKTPPGSPSKRKIVRFADIFGLDLTDVKMYLDEVPRVPKSAFQDLKDADISDLDSDSSTSFDKVGVNKTQGNNVTKKATCEIAKIPSHKPPSAGVKALFVQPNGTPTMLNRLRDNKICLETAYPCDAQSIVKGVVRVVNLDFHKKVSVRYTMDNWVTFSDADAAYLSGTCDGFSDKFSFVVDTSQLIGNPGKRLQLCLHFQCLGNDYWDNNNGANYVFQYIAAGRQSPPRELSTNNNQQSYNIPSRGIPITSRGREPGRTSSQGPQEISHVYQPMSHSPSAMDDPWQRFM